MRNASGARRCRVIARTRESVPPWPLRRRSFTIRPSAATHPRDNGACAARGAVYCLARRRFVLHERVANTAPPHSACPSATTTTTIILPFLLTPPPPQQGRYCRRGRSPVTGPMVPVGRLVRWPIVHRERVRLRSRPRR